MPDEEPAARAVGLTVYGCEPDEAERFTAVSPGFGVVPTITSDAPSADSAVAAFGNRCISVGHKSAISGSTLRALSDAGVEHISTRSAGFDHIDLDAAEELGLTVENVEYAPDGVADYTVMLLLMAIRNAKAIISSAQQHDFRLRGERARDLCDMTVGIVGLGNVGTAVATRLRGFGCRVLASTKNPQAASAATELVSLDDLLRASDVVTLHVPLNPETQHIIGREQVEMMKPGAFLINTGRGALVETAALLAALENGQLGGAALDVLEGEEGHFYVDRTGTPLDNRFLLRLQALPNAIVTPHTAYYTTRALHDTVEMTLARCLDFERNRANGATHRRDLVWRLLRGA